MCTFSEALASDLSEGIIIASNCKTEVKGIFVNTRVDRKTLPKGWLAYDIRHDNNGAFCTVEPVVRVNHAGTILCKKPIRMNNRGFYSLRGRGGYTFTGLKGGEHG